MGSVPGTLGPIGAAQVRASAAMPVQAHRLLAARFQPSPHQDARPDAEDIDTIVVHGISLPPGEFGGPWIDALFAGTLDADAHPYFATIASLAVSAHCCIFRDGRLTQYVAFDRRAWHAGQSRFDGRERVNDFSIGIELEGDDDTPYTDPQYAQLAQLCIGLIEAYPRITPARIVGHSDIAPGRKTDPGPHFDWLRLLAAVEHRR